MDYSIIINFVQTVGFPAVCVVGMAWFVKYITDQHHKEMNELNNLHRNEMIEVTAALNNNTLALQKLTDLIQMDYGNKEE